MLPRTLEPEVMDTVEEAVDYDSMDHSGVNKVFVDDCLKFVRNANQPPTQSPVDLGTVFDAGTGTALIPIELCQRPDVVCQVVASDYAAEMLILADRNIATAELGDRITTSRVDCKDMQYAEASFDTVISNSIVHHIPEPIKVMREMVRTLKPGGCLFVRDLLRPTDATTVDSLVETYAADANAHQQKMFRESLHAALTVAEVQHILQQVGLPPDCVQQTTDRHWTLAVRKPM